MKADDTIHLGDGAYLHYDGHGFELRANDHQHPTDRVYLDLYVMKELLSEVNRTLTPEKPLMDKYTDNYMTDENGQRWVKKEYAQAYADAAGKGRVELEKIQKEIIDLKLDLNLAQMAVSQSKGLLESCELALEERDKKLQLLRGACNGSR